MDRRQFLTVAGATALVPALGIEVADAHELMMRQVVKNIVESFGSTEQIAYNERLGFPDNVNTPIAFSAAASVGIMKRYPDLYDPHLVMDGPVSEIRGTKVMARTRLFAARWGFELEGLPKSEILRNVSWETLLEQIAIEIRQERDRMAALGVKAAPYVPVMSGGVVIDPASFQPLMIFKTRYGGMAA